MPNGSTERDREERIEQVLDWLRVSTPRTEILKRVRRDWNVSRATATRYVQEADRQLVDTISPVDRATLMANLIEQLSNAAEMAFQQRNPGAAIAALNSLAKLTKLDR